MLASNKIFLPVLRLLRQVSHLSLLSWCVSRRARKAYNQCCGSGIRCFFDPWIPNPYFWELSDNLLGKISINLWKLAQVFLSSAFQKYKYFQFCEICGYKKRVWQQIFFHPSLLLLFLDPGWVKIRIRYKHLGSATQLVIKEKHVIIPVLKTVNPDLRNRTSD